jgi:hypothetical protein
MHAQWHGLDAKARTVRHLHLRVPHENDSVRARIALEDGLATADFGDAGRLILVRHLTLPRFVGDLSGPKAARVIEASYRALLPTAVHGADPRAPMTNVVWFEDRLEALLEALSVRVDERPLNAWFWRQALGPLYPVSSAEAVPGDCNLGRSWARQTCRPARIGATLADVERTELHEVPAVIAGSNAPGCGASDADGGGGGRYSYI